MAKIFKIIAFVIVISSGFYFGAYIAGAMLNGVVGTLVLIIFLNLMFAAVCYFIGEIIQRTARLEDRFEHLLKLYKINRHK